MNQDDKILDELIEEQPASADEDKDKGEWRRWLPQLGRGWGVFAVAMVVGLVVFTVLQQKFRSHQSVIAAHFHQPNISNYILEPEEQQHLLYMREEEKLALDVYQFLAQRWGQRIFFSISRSEQRHTTAIAQLLKQFGMADPALDAPAGVFQNPELAKLYQTLTARGGQSLMEALHVGGLIEEVDIKDLDTAIQASKHPTVTTVYRRIQNGSYHHLRAFVHAIEVVAAPYQPQLLPQDRVDQIVGGALSAF
jgi:hypothetical protein